MALVTDFRIGDTPKRRLGCPAAVSACGQLAPFGIAVAKARNNPCFEDCVFEGVGFRPVAQDGVVGFDHHGPCARQHPVMHPAALAVAVDHAAPVAVFGNNLKWHVASFKDPVNAVRQRRAAADIGLSCAERDIARQGEVRFGADRGALVALLGDACAHADDGHECRDRKHAKPMRNCTHC